MEGKTIKSTLDMGQGYTLLGFDDDTAALVHVIEPELSMDELKEFVGEAAPKKGKDEKPAKEEEKSSKEKPSKKEEVKEDDSLDWEGLEKLDHDELTELCKENDLKTDPDDFEDEEDDLLKFRTAIAEECGIDVPESTSDDDYTWDDLKAMDWDELKDVIEEEDLKTDIDDFDEDTDEDKLRRAIAKELDIEAPVKKKVGK